jgi:uncharacterized membrane protein
MDIQVNAAVECTDGRIGEVSELLSDPKTGAVTHFVLREKRLFGAREISLPVSAVDRETAGSIYLKLDKRAVGTLPPIPIRRRRDAADSKKLQLGARLFDDPKKAHEALRALKDVEGALNMRNAAVLVKDEDGKTSVEETGDVSAKGGAFWGGVVGGFVGIVGGLAGIIVGVLAGALAGSIAAKLIDRGFPDDFLKALLNYMKPNSSAILIVVDDATWARKIADSLGDIQGVFMYQTITDEMVKRMMEKSAS